MKQKIVISRFSNRTFCESYDNNHKSYHHTKPTTKQKNHQPSIQICRINREKAIKATNGIGLQPTMDWLLVNPDDNDNKNKDRCEGRGVNNNNKSNDGYGKIITSSNSSISGGDHELMIKTDTNNNTTTTKTNDYSETRLQLIMPDGTRNTHTFKSTDALELVYVFIGEHIAFPFHLMTTFPRRELDGSERSKSLKELNLTPSATLVVNTL
nr:481_t:CDS:2 [Entrophospora candida]